MSGATVEEPVAPPGTEIGSKEASTPPPLKSMESVVKAEPLSPLPPDITVEEIPNFDVPAVADEELNAVDNEELNLDSEYDMDPLFDVVDECSGDEEEETSRDRKKSESSVKEARGSKEREERRRSKEKGSRPRSRERDSRKTDVRRRSPIRFHRDSVRDDRPRRRTPARRGSKSKDEKKDEKDSSRSDSKTDSRRADIRRRSPIRFRRDSVRDDRPRRRSPARRDSKSKDERATSERKSPTKKDEKRSGSRDSKSDAKKDSKPLRERDEKRSNSKDNIRARERRVSDRRDTKKDEQSSDSKAMEDKLRIEARKRRRSRSRERRESTASKDAASAAAKKSFLDEMKEKFPDLDLKVDPKKELLKRSRSRSPLRRRSFRHSPTPPRIRERRRQRELERQQQRMASAGYVSTPNMPTMYAGQWPNMPLVDAFGNHINPYAVPLPPGDPNYFANGGAMIAAAANGMVNPAFVAPTAYVAPPASKSPSKSRRSRSPVGRARSPRRRSRSPRRRSRSPQRRPRSPRRHRSKSKSRSPRRRVPSLSPRRNRSPRLVVRRSVERIPGANPTAPLGAGFRIDLSEITEQLFLEKKIGISDYLTTKMTVLAKLKAAIAALDSSNANSAEVKLLFAMPQNSYNVVESSSPMLPSAQNPLFRATAWLPKAEATRPFKFITSSVAWLVCALGLDESRISYLLGQKHQQALQTAPFRPKTEAPRRAITLTDASTQTPDQVCVRCYERDNTYLYDVSTQTRVPEMLPIACQTDETTKRESILERLERKRREIEASKEFGDIIAPPAPKTQPVVAPPGFKELYPHFSKKEKIYGYTSAERR